MVSSALHGDPWGYLVAFGWWLVCSGGSKMVSLTGSSLSRYVWKALEGSVSQAQLGSSPGTFRVSLPVLSSRRVRTPHLMAQGPQSKGRKRQEMKLLSLNQKLAQHQSWPVDG